MSPVTSSPSVTTSSCPTLTRRPLCSTGAGPGSGAEAFERADDLLQPPERAGEGLCADGGGQWPAAGQPQDRVSPRPEQRWGAGSRGTEGCPGQTELPLALRSSLFCGGGGSGLEPQQSAFALGLGLASPELLGRPSHQS